MDLSYYLLNHSLIFFSVVLDDTHFIKVSRKGEQEFFKITAVAIKLKDAELSGGRTDCSSFNYSEGK